MNHLEKKKLVEEIRNIEQQNMEEILLMVGYCFTTYIKSLMTFGFQNAITKDVVNVWKEFHKILIEERNIMHVLLQYKDLKNITQANALLNTLEQLNEYTVRYYYDVLDDIELACETKTEWRAKRRKKTFETLIETKSYHREACALLLNMDDIKRFLNYPYTFWQYIEKRIEHTDDCFLHGVNMKMDTDDSLVDIKVFVPVIINLQTALVNVHELKHAYDLYQLLGNPLDKDEDEYEKSAKEFEDSFKEEYIVKKYQQLVKK